MNSHYLGILIKMVHSFPIKKLKETDSCFFDQKWYQFMYFSSAKS